MTINFSSVFAEGDFAATDCVIAAVSGGSDSLAMLFLLHGYLLHHGGGRRLVAVTVDHGLRAASAHEADAVAQLCAGYGIAHETVCWQGGRPQSALSSQARLARYELLCRAAAKYGAGVIVTGHTLDDQAETYAMRLSRGSGRGLAAMARLALLRQKFGLLRPLLEVRRRDLRHYLMKRGIRWIEDPSNENVRYERARLRECLDEAAIIAAWHGASAAAQERRHLSQAAAALARKLRMRLNGEQLRFNLAALEAQDRPAWSVLVAMGAAIMGGALYPAVGRQVLERLLAQQSALPRRVTLSGAVIEVTGKFLHIWREKRNLASCALPAGQSTLWDGRYRLSNTGDETVIVRAPARAELHRLVKAERLHAPEGAVDLHFPSLETACMICGRYGLDLPVLTRQALQNRNIRLQRIMMPFDWLVPGHDVAMFEAFQSAFRAQEGEKNKNGLELS